MSGSPIVDLADASFEAEVLESETPVLVYAGAQWSGPTDLTATIVDELAREYHPSVRTVRLDVDRASEVAASYAIDTVPAFLLFVDGEVVDRRAGALTRPPLEALYGRGEDLSA